MLKRLLLASTLLAPGSASASQLTVFDVSSFGGEVLATTEISGYSTNFLGGTSGGVVSALQNGNQYELAANDVHNIIPDTLNIYALWQGVTTPTGLITLSTMMATDEYGCCSWYISEEVYVNGNLIGGNTQVGLYGAPNQTFKVTENTPFDLQLQLQFVSDGVYPYGDFGSYVVASLVDAPPQPVPGPEVGAGLPGLLGLLGLWWYRRQRDATRLISPAEWSR